MNAHTPLTAAKAGAIMEAVLIRGDLSALTEAERAKYFTRVCESVGLNPMTKPLEYITLNGKLTLYAKRDAADQLRKLHGVSITIVSHQEADGLLTVHVWATDKDGRADEDFGVVSLPEALKGEARANTILKAITKAKRRVTLSICGLGFLDETEIEDIPTAAKEAPARATSATVTTLPKKNCKDIYSKLQAEVDGVSTAAELEEWSEANACRVAVLPADWQLILSLRFEEKLAELRQREAKSVVWEEDRERPATTADVPVDDFAIPPMLDRRTAKAAPIADSAWYVAAAARLALHGRPGAA